MTETTDTPSYSTMDLEDAEAVHERCCQIVAGSASFSSFRGGASGLKERGVPTLSRKRDASRPERKPTRTFATTMLHHTLLPASAVRPQVARSTGRSSPALNGGFVDPEGRPVGGAHKTPRRANRGRKPHQSPTLNERGRKAERSRVGSVTSAFVSIFRSPVTNRLATSS